MISRNRRNPRTEYVSASCPPGWAWLVAGILIGMFVSFLVYLREFSPQHLPPESAEVTNSSTEAPEVTGENPDFDFELVLPGGTATEGQETKKEAKTSDFPVTKPGRYFLQVGSFKEERGAEGLKSYLISIGIPATIETTSLSADIGRWYRVQVGP
ncbi:SPOR domain-containing protein, partial [Candidatus Marithioploca araucensis]|nr:SPOR domain-containing protein [Candidatus Marithioploca araucensis]